MSVLAFALWTRAAEFEAVSSQASPDYVRSRLPDGSFKPESYVFGKGGYSSGPLNDGTIDKMNFLTVAHIVAGPLAEQRYIPAKDPRATKLLIMVYWGTTNAPEHASDSPEYLAAQRYFEIAAAMPKLPIAGPHSPVVKLSPQAEDVEFLGVQLMRAENAMRDNENRRNAMLLGYNSWWNATNDAPMGTPKELQRQDMIDELEEDRYFVVLMAYDFQALWKDKKHLLLWDTRFSIREHNHQFDRQLAAMTAEASRYFGRNSDGLKHDPLPEGTVEVGEVRNLGAIPEK